MATSNPPVRGGKIIGRPYQGTHAQAFNKKGGSDNWESENAVDIAVPKGTPIYAVEDGTIGSQFGSLGTGGRFAGLRLHLDGQQGNFYYAHLSAFAPGLKPGSVVKAGQVIGYSGEANGVQHLHFAEERGDPTSYVTGIPSKAPAAGSYSNPNPAPTPDATTPNADGSVDMSGGTAPQLQADIQNVPQQPLAPLASAPTIDDQPDPNASLYAPQSAAANTWQLLAAQGNVSPDTLRLAQLANYSGNASPQQQ